MRSGTSSANVVFAFRADLSWQVDLACQLCILSFAKHAKYAKYAKHAEAGIQLPAESKIVYASTRKSLQSHVACGMIDDHGLVPDALSFR